MAVTSRRQMLKLTAYGTAALAMIVRPHNLLAQPPHRKSTALAPAAFRLLPLGDVRPAGWLRRQLRVQADGLSGHLDEFWPDVGSNSGWLGGAGESWERGPYFVDGLLPLAFLLEDDALKAKAMRYINWTLDHPQPDGMIGPRSNDDWWPRMVMVKALAQYYEVSRDPRVLPVMTRYFRHQLETMPARPLVVWGKYRWQDEVLIVEWLYDRTADPRLLELCALLQQQGYDWEAMFVDFPLREPTSRDVLHHEEAGLQAHGVNHAQALKTAAVQYRLTGDPAAQSKYFRQIGALDRYHGMPNGMYSCDEHLGGLDPSHGSELCSVVESMYSMEVSLATFGAAPIGDRIEKLAYNALPGTFTDDMWAHQYDQQSNQVLVGLNSKPWTTNGPESNLFGLEPHFGCCTANYHQGWPKFAASLWMTSQEDGLVAALYAPCDVQTKVRGTPVHLLEETEYPFRETIRITVNPDTPLRFPLQLRIPEWAMGATALVNDKPASATLIPGSFARIDRTWSKGDMVTLTLPMKPRVSRWFEHSVALERGPLVFSLDPGAEWVKLRQRGLTADWQVFPTGQWNYALAVNETSVAEVKVAESPLGALPFSAAHAPVRLLVKGKRFDAWRSEDGVALPLPASPVTSQGAMQMLTLVPYAGAKLRITAFPQLQI